MKASREEFSKWQDALAAFSVTCKQLHSLNRINTEIWDRLKPNKKGNSLVVCKLSSLTFRDQCLTFEFTNQTLPLTSLKLLFNEANNFFNDKLPEADYEDLEPVIKKYEVLNPVSGVSILQQWKTALEKVQVYLGEKEQMIISNEKLLKKICELFKVEEKSTQVKFIPKVFKCGTMNLELKIEKVSEEALEEIVQFAKIVTMVYEPGEAILEPPPEAPLQRSMNASHKGNGWKLFKVNVPNIQKWECVVNSMESTWNTWGLVIGAVPVDEPVNSWIATTGYGYIAMTGELQGVDSRIIKVVPYTTGDKILVERAGQTSLTFYKNGKVQGSIPNVSPDFIPAVSIASNTQVTLRY